MKVRVLLTIVTGVVFLFAVSTQDLRAAAATLPAAKEELHSVAKAELHDVLLAASAETAAARKSVQDFLLLLEVRSQIERMGFEPAAVASRAALLSDSELLRLQAQIMTADQQLRTAGMPRWGIILMALGILVVIMGIIVVTDSD